MQESYLDQNKGVPNSMLTLAPLTKSDFAWNNCYDPSWTDLVEEHPVDLTDDDTWALMLRNEYCKDIRHDKYWEWIYDIPMFVPAAGEPESCMESTNMMTIMNTIWTNLGDNWYYGNYNGWLRDRHEEAKLGQMHFTCTLTEMFYKSTA